MAKKQITIVEGEEPKFLFINKSGRYATIFTMSEAVNVGTPIVEDGHDDSGDDMTFVGRVEDDIPVGELDLNTYDLPHEALQIVEDNKGHLDEFDDEFDEDFDDEDDEEED